MNVIILVKVIPCEPPCFMFIERVGRKIGYRKIKKKRKKENRNTQKSLI